MSRLPRVVIIGRPNVGKSTLFNRLYGRRRALVHDLPGVTRDRLEEEAQWWIRGQSLKLKLVDTGGLYGETFAKEIDRQVEIAISEADVVLMLFDGQMGVTQQDEEVINRVRRSGIGKKGVPVIGLVNKVDAESHEERLNEFYATGLEHLLTISAEHGRGMDDLQEKIHELLPDELKAQEPAGEEAPHDGPPRIAIVGRPNVGKSTLINALLKEERMITSPIAGTTVDAVDSLVELGGKPYILVDTAGIRRKSKTEQGVEVLSVVQTRKALERCDVAILMLDGEGGTTDQDEKVGSLIEEVGCGVVLIVNKWDLQRKLQPGFTQDMAAEVVRERMGFMRYAPLMFISALKGQGIDGIGDLVDEILTQRQVKISTKEFTEWVKTTSEIHNPFGAKFYMSHQTGRYPPTFVCHVNDPKKVHFSLKRALVNKMRERWGFMGSPVRLLFVKAENQRK